jgi:hypothetical protein
VRAEEVIAFLLVLPRLGDVYGDPALSAGVEVRPAVITGDLRGQLVGGKWEPDLEARRLPEL